MITEVTVLHSTGTMSQCKNYKSACQRLREILWYDMPITDNPPKVAIILRYSQKNQFASYSIDVDTEMMDVALSTTFSTDLTISMIFCGTLNEVTESLGVLANG